MNSQMIDREIYDIIRQKLVEIEKSRGVEILYAVESGSRAWGFSSRDSDYDARFIYRHELKWYLSVLPKRDVIELPVENDLDINGWDIKKTLFLLNKSNPVLFEWLKSPIIYRKHEAFFEIMSEISDSYFSPIATIYHYLHMASGNYREYLKGQKVKVKKYFYVLRPVLACRWVEKLKSQPPMEFRSLVDEIVDDPSIRRIIEELLERKMSGNELGEEDQIPELNRYLEANLDHIKEAATGYNPALKPEKETLDEAFQKILEL